MAAECRFLAGKNSRTIRSKVKEGLFRKTHSKERVRTILEGTRPQGVGFYKGG